MEFLTTSERYLAREIEARVNLLAGMKTGDAPGEWEPWLKHVFPTYVDKPFAPHHRSYWDHIWQVELDTELDPFVGVWARGGGKSMSIETGVASFAARRTRRYGLYVCETQDQADQHVANTRRMLETPRFFETYPHAGRPRVSRYGGKEWRRDRITTASGFTLDPLGLNTASRGVRMDEIRPDLLILDDIDNILDTPAKIRKKVNIITKNIMPALGPTPLVLAVQNLIRPDGVFGQLCGRSDKPADFLVNAIVSGPIPAIIDLQYETEVLPSGKLKYHITGGRPTWEGQGIERCERMMSRMGIRPFLDECQHDDAPEPGGYYDDVEFERCAANAVPELVRVTTWIDPAVTDKEQSDSCGIQIDGLDQNGRIFRLYSEEVKSSPAKIIRRAILKNAVFGGDTIGVETDQGGDTWRDLYRMIAADMKAQGLIDTVPRYRDERAGSGWGPKTHRGTQMLGRYEMGVFVHVIGTHNVLERALIRFPKKPLDLADAAFWSSCELLPYTKGGQGSSFAG